MAQIVGDSFTGTANALLSAYNAAWVKVTGVTGDFTINSGGAGFINNSGASAAQYRNDANPASADYSVQAVFFVTATGSTGAAANTGVMGRASTSANTLYTARFNGANTELYKFIAGTATLLQGVATPAPSTGVSGFVLLKLEMIGPALKVFIDGNSLAAISVNDGAITAIGKPGIRGGTGGVVGDDFSADDIAGGVQTRTVTPSGGISFSGTAPAVRSTIKTPTGGIILSGTAASVRGATRAASGGITLSGAATVLRSAVREAAGGLAFSGAAAVSFFSAVQTRIITPAGGIVFSGTAAIVRTCTRLTSGGISLAGNASVVLNYFGAVVGNWIGVAKHRRRD